MLNLAPEDSNDFVRIVSFPKLRFWNSKMFPNFFSESTIFLEFSQNQNNLFFKAVLWIKSLFGENHKLENFFSEKSNFWTNLRKLDLQEMGGRASVGYDQVMLESQWSQLRRNVEATGRTTRSRCGLATSGCYSRMTAQASAAATHFGWSRFLGWFHVSRLFGRFWYFLNFFGKFWCFSSFWAFPRIFGVQQPLVALWSILWR